MTNPDQLTLTLRARDVRATISAAGALMASPKGRVVYRVLEVWRVRRAGDQRYAIRLVCARLGRAEVPEGAGVLPWPRDPRAPRAATSCRPHPTTSRLTPTRTNHPRPSSRASVPRVRPTNSPGSPARRGSGAMMACSTVGTTAQGCGSGRRVAGGVASDCARRTSKSRTVLIQIGRTIRSGGRGDRIHSWRCCVPKRSPPASSTRPSCFAMNCKRRRRRSHALGKHRSTSSRFGELASATGR